LDSIGGSARGIKMTAAAQEEVLEFLGRAPAPGEAPPRRIDTHAASVFLFPHRALKIKRAVKFPFLDYSTLALREAACEAELAVNRPYAPQVYRRVVAITRAPGRTLAIGGDGEPVEWAVEMTRFDERCTLDHMADRGEIDAALADALGRTVAAAHAQAQAVADPQPWIKAIGAYIEEHDAAFREMPDVFPPEDLRELTQAMRGAYARMVPLLQSRGERGLIRRCHGDLHLGNIVLIEGQPVLFDAIEFSEIIATCDVLYDLAFLLMDLFARGLNEPANVVFNRYLIETHRDADLDGLAALPYFLAMRAAIRAKVTAARLKQNAKDRDAVAQAARKYFDLARQLIAAPAPKLIGVGGLSGTGKSLLARMLAPQVLPVPGAVLLRSDVARKRMFGMPETERLPPESYTPQAAAKLYAALGETARQVIAAGHSVIVDAVFSKPEERRALAEIARGFGMPLRGLFLITDLAVRLKRVGARKADASDADADVVAQQEHYDLGAMDWTIIDANGTREETQRRARAALAPDRQ
jgi:aminoglycoside phosphotransferase family enzyme/predicted kinase